MDKDPNNPNIEKCSICGELYHKNNMPLHVIKCNKEHQKDNPVKPKSNPDQKPASPTTPVSPPKPVVPPKPPTPKNKNSFVPVVVTIAAIALIALAVFIVLDRQNLKDQMADQQAAFAAAEADRIAAAEELAKQPPTQPPFTSRREPPTIVKVDEFTITTNDGERLLIGLPIIAGHGQQGVYLGSQPPASDVRFAHDSKWVKDGKPISKWHPVQVAHWDPDARRYIPISGMPLIKRTLPDGSIRHQEIVWAMVMPKS